MNIPSWFCKHKFGVISEKTLEPPNNKNGRYLESTADSDGVPMRFTQETHIVIMSCKKCGVVYKSVERG